MTNTELANGLPKPKQFDIQISAGLWVRVTPLSQMSKVLLEQQAAKLYPEVDETPFRKPADGMPLKFTDKSNPEYKRLVAERAENVNNYMLSFMFRECIEILDGAKVVQDRDTVLEVYCPALERLRKTGLEGLPEDDWHCVVRFLLLEDFGAFQRVMNALKDRMPLTKDEILEAGFRVFQYPLRRATPDTDGHGGDARSVPSQPVSERAS